MYKREYFFRTILVIVLMVCVICILSGNDWLLIRLNILFGFHLGTIISWIGLIACSLISVQLNSNLRFLRNVSSVSFYISIFWLLLSYLIAGNNNLIFTKDTHSEFIIWLAITFFPLFIFLVSLIQYVWVKILKFNKNKVRK